MSAGLGNTTGPLRAATVRHLLEGQALDDFENYMRQDGVTETLENVNKALKMVAVTVFPADAVTNMKHYLNFELKKPKALKARALKTRLERLNSWFEYFPTDGDGRIGQAANSTVVRQKSPEILVEIPISGERKSQRILRALLDSGSTGCIILNEFKVGLSKKVDKTERWTTKGGTFTTKGKCRVTEF